MPRPHPAQLAASPTPTPTPTHGVRSDAANTATEPHETATGRPEPRERLQALMAELADLGPQLCLATRSPAARLDGHGAARPGSLGGSTGLETGFAEVDRLLGGGFPRDRLCEVSGPPSSGRTSLVLGLLARTTAAGECAAFVDPGDGFDPASASAAGAVLEHVLWARPRLASHGRSGAPARRAPKSERELLRCIERLLETQGLPLVLLDLASGPHDARAPALGPATWLRLARLARASATALVVLSRERQTGAHAQLALEMQPARAHFAGTPALLERLETQAVLVRHRSAPTGRAASLRLGDRAA